MSVGRREGEMVQKDYLYGLKKKKMHKISLSLLCTSLEFELYVKRFV